jgi:hypothetical protein
MTTILLILGAACLTILAVNSEPTNYLLDLVGLRKPNAKGIQGALSRLTACCLCSGFWIGLAITENIILAAIIAVTAEAINNKLL